MTASEIPSPVFRRTSLTTRQRLTPARACSTRTRMRPSLRLPRFWAAVSSPPAGFFFRLAGPGPRRLVALEAAVLVQGGPRRVGDPLVVGDGLVGGAAGVGAAEEADPPAAGLHDHHVLVAVPLLPPAV